jgi:hypothetical protein
MSPTINMWDLRVVWPISIRVSAWKLQSSTHCPELLCSAWQRITHQILGLAATVTDLPSVSGAPLSDNSWWPLCPQQKNQVTHIKAALITGKAVGTEQVNRRILHVLYRALRRVLWMKPTNALMIIYVVHWPHLHVSVAFCDHPQGAQY